MVLSNIYEYILEYIFTLEVTNHVQIYWKFIRMSGSAKEQCIWTIAQNAVKLLAGTPSTGKIDLKIPFPFCLSRISWQYKIIFLENKGLFQGRRVISTANRFPNSE